MASHSSYENEDRPVRAPEVTLTLAFLSLQGASLRDQEQRGSWIRGSPKEGQQNQVGEDKSQRWANTSDRVG